MKLRTAALLTVCCLIFGVFPSAYAEENTPIRTALLDSGVSVKHLDGSRVEDGENFVFPSQNTNDRIGHGTAAAGLILGSEELGLEGCCPSAVIVPLVCFDTYPTGAEAPSDTAYMAQAIRAAVDRYDCRIINISMGTTEDNAELRSAVAYAVERGALIVSAVGNENLTEPEAVYYPAAYDGVIGVGAADGDRAADFSQRSSVDVLAQGVGLKTVTRRNAAEYELRSGTSYACAYVSGVCADIWSKSPELTSEQVYERLLESVRDIGEPGFDRDSGWGLVEQNAAAEETADSGVTDMSEYMDNGETDEPMSGNETDTAEYMNGGEAGAPKYGGQNIAAAYYAGAAACGAALLPCGISALRLMLGLYTSWLPTGENGL